MSLPSAPHWSTDMSPYQDLQKELNRDNSALGDFSALRKGLPEVQRLNLRDLPPDSPDLPEPTAFGGDLPDLPGNGRAQYRSGAAEEPASPAPCGVRAGGDKTHSALLEKILRKGLASPAPSRIGRGPDSSTPSGAPATGSRLKFPSDVPKNWDGIANLSTASLNSFPSPIKRRPGAQDDSMFGAPPSIASSRAYLASPAPPATSSNPLKASTSRRAPPSPAASSSSFLSRTPAKEAARRTALNVYDSLAFDSPGLELAPPTVKFEDMFGKRPEEETPGLDRPSQRSTLSRPGGALRSGASNAGNDSYLSSAPAQPSFVDRSPTQLSAQHHPSSSSISRDVPLADFGGGTTANIDDLLAGAPTMTYDHHHNPLAGPIDPQQYAGIVNDDDEPHQPTGGYGADESFTGDAEDDQPHHLHRREEPTYTGYDDYEQSLAGEGGGRGLRLPGQDGPEDTLFGMPPGRGGADAAKAGRTARFADVEDDSFTDSGGVDGGKSGFRLHGLSDMETLHGGELLSSGAFRSRSLLSFGIAHSVCPPRRTVPGESARRQELSVDGLRVAQPLARVLVVIIYSSPMIHACSNPLYGCPSLHRRDFTSRREVACPRPHALTRFAAGLDGMSGMFGTPGVSKKPSPYSASRHHPSTTPSRQQPSQLSPDQQQEVREAFELFDLDKDQKLDYHEFKVALRALGFDLKKAEVLKLMREHNHDEGGSGSLTIGLSGFMGIGASLERVLRLDEHLTSGNADLLVLDPLPHSLTRVVIALFTQPSN